MVATPCPCCGHKIDAQWPVVYYDTIVFGDQRVTVQKRVAELCQQLVLHDTGAARSETIDKIWGVGRGSACNFGVTLVKLRIALKRLGWQVVGGRAGRGEDPMYWLIYSAPDTAQTGMLRRGA